MHPHTPYMCTHTHRKSRRGGYITVIPARGRLRQEGSPYIQGQPRQHNEFQASLGLAWDLVSKEKKCLLYGEREGYHSPWQGPNTHIQVKHGHLLSGIYCSLELEKITLSEVTRAQKDKHHMFYFICRSKFWPLGARPSHGAHSSMQVKHSYT